MHNFTFTSLRKPTLVKIAILFPLVLIIAGNCWYSLLIFFGALAVCTLGLLFSDTPNLKNANPAKQKKVNDPLDPYLGCGTLSTRKRLRGF